MSVFGLTAVDIADSEDAPTSPGPARPHSRGAPPRSPSAPAHITSPAPTHITTDRPPSPAPLPSPQPTLPVASTLPDLLAASPTATYLTEPPSISSTPTSAAAAARASVSSPTPARKSLTKLAVPIPAPRASPSLTPPPGASPAGRLPPLGSPQPASAHAAATPADASPDRLSPRNAGGSPPPSSSAAFVPRRTASVLAAASSTPAAPQGAAAANLAPCDPRNFDGKDLQELVRVSSEDYQDLPRLQSILIMQLGGRTTEAAQADALLQIRAASIANPLFTITPPLLDCVRQHLAGRNRLLRPAAAAALAGYAAHSRAGRGLLTVAAEAVLPRLVAMLRCRIDSMDARYGSLAILTATMHPEHKELVGRSGAIPALMHLVRQNLGRHANAAHTDTSMMDFDAVLNLMPQQTRRSQPEGDDGDYSGSALSTARSGAMATGSGAAAAPSNPHGAAASAGNPSSGPQPGVPSDPASPSAADALDTDRPSASGNQPPRRPSREGYAPGPHDPSATDPSPSPDRPRHSQYDAGHGHGVGTGTHPGRASGTGSGALGTYSLAVKPAGAHAMAALVNLAELPANRARMREAGIAALMEDVMACRNENTIKERCRLLIDFVQMDAPRFLQAQAAANADLLSHASHALVAFSRAHGTHPGAAHHAGGMHPAGGGGGSRRPSDAHNTAGGNGGGGGANGGGGGSISGGTPRPVLGGNMTRGTLTWAMARQLEQSADAGDDRHSPGGGGAVPSAAARSGTMTRSTAQNGNGGNAAGGTSSTAGLARAVSYRADLRAGAQGGGPLARNASRAAGAGGGGGGSSGSGGAVAAAPEAGARTIGAAA